MRISLESLSDTALDAIVESFVLREGTDYGIGEVAFADKCAAVRRQLSAGEAWIDFDPETESVDIRPSESRR